MLVKSGHAVQVWMRDTILDASFLQEDGVVEEMLFQSRDEKAKIFLQEFSLKKISLIYVSAKRTFPIYLYVLHTICFLTET